MRLSDRLETVVSMVRPAESAADIGTDHGHVPVELVRRGTVKRALAMDVRKGPLSRAEDSVAMAGLENRIETRLSDGLRSNNADSFTHLYRFTGSHVGAVTLGAYTVLAFTCKNGTDSDCIQ